MVRGLFVLKTGNSSEFLAITDNIDDSLIAIDFDIPALQGLQISVFRKPVVRRVKRMA